MSRPCGREIEGTPGPHLKFERTSRRKFVANDVFYFVPSGEPVNEGREAAVSKVRAR